MRHSSTAFRVLAACAPAAMMASASAQLRVASWNISNYGGGRVADLQTAFYGEFAGRSMRPDVLVVQEVLSASAMNALTAALNGAAGGPGDWASGAFVDGPDTDSAFFYRTSRATLLATVIAAPGSTSTSDQPRHTMRYDFRPVGYTSDPATIALYSVHMKAGNSSTDQNRRQIEASRIAANVLTLPAGWNHIIGGDFNIQSSNQLAYQTLLTRFVDPIATPGLWNNNIAFRFVHTQDPAGAGGMDDRHDQLLIAPTLTNGSGLEYVGNAAIPYSTTTWNDANHSYRAWGNDGSSFNTTLRVVGNEMVGPTIAQALINVSNGAGHLPVLLDLRLPAEAAATPELDFGDVLVGDTATLPVSVINAGDVSRWGVSGISTLHYTMSPSAGFVAPAGPFADAAGGSGNSHNVSFTATAAGLVLGTLTISTDAPDTPTLLVALRARGVAPCPADFNGDGFLDFFDYSDYVECFEGGVCPPGRTADFNGDGFTDFFDFADYAAAFEAGC